MSDFPSSVHNALLASRTPLENDQYDSYDQYLDTIKKNFKDIKFSKRVHDHSRNTSPPQDFATTTYALDIGKFSDSGSSDWSIRSSPPISENGNLNALLDGAALGTKLRIIFHTYNYSYYGLLEIASFYDINPRLMQQRFTDYFKGWHTAYLPSEAKFTPIQFKRALRKFYKETDILFLDHPSLGYRTVLVLTYQRYYKTPAHEADIKTDQEEASFNYSEDIINRDILYPSQKIPKGDLGNWRQPQNDAETCYLRLAALGSAELEACMHQPILSVLPVVRTFALETSQDLMKLGYRFHIDTLEDVFYSFEAINRLFRRSFRSLEDHISLPWLDMSQPHADYARMMVDRNLADMRRIWDEVSDMRERVREFSAHVSAKEAIFEARRSVATGDSVHQLTRLAFIFIPLTFASSLFGMNINEWQEEVPHFWAFIVTAVVCTILTTTIAIMFARCAPEARRILKDHYGYLGTLRYAIIAFLINFLAVFAITIPRKFRDTKDQIREYRKKRREEKKSAVHGLA